MRNISFLRIIWSLIVGTRISGIVMMYAAESARLDATIETSHIDKREYLVLKHQDQQQALNTLARIKKILDTLCLNSNMCKMRKNRKLFEGYLLDTSKPHKT